MARRQKKKEEGYVYPLDNTGKIPCPVTSPKLEKDFLIPNSVGDSGASAGLGQKMANSGKNAMATAQDGKEKVVKWGGRGEKKREIEILGEKAKAGKGK